MKHLAALCIKRPVFAAMLVMCLVVIGSTSYFGLGVDRFPSIDLPTVNIRTQLPGASPEEMEILVSQRIEEAVNTVEGIEELRSVSGSGVSQVIATFSLDRPIESATQDVRDRVAATINQLPRDARAPVVTKFDSDSQPVITIAVAANRPLRELTEIADKLIKPLLERSAGVGEVNITGGLERAISVWVDADRLAAYQLADYRGPGRARATECRLAGRQRHERRPRADASDDGAGHHARGLQRHRHRDA